MTDLSKKQMKLCQIGNDTEAAFIVSYTTILNLKNVLCV